MIRQLIPALQATPPHPLLVALDIGSPHVLHLTWSDTPPGRLCNLLTWVAKHSADAGVHNDTIVEDTIAEAKAIVSALTPDELLTVQLHAPAAVRMFVLANLDLPTP